MPDYDFDRSGTENLLAILRAENVRAIFFLRGEAIDANPNGRALVQLIAKDRHVVGNHSYSHLYATREPVTAIIEDFARNHELIHSITGEEVRVFRPPHGDWNAELTKRFLASHALGNYQFPIFWTSLFREWALKSKAELANLDGRLTKFKESIREGSGKIVLLHDTYVAGVLLASLIIKEAGRHGYEIGNPDDLVAAVAAATGRFRKTPFRYYLTILMARVRLRLTNQRARHANYEMDQ